MGQGQGRHEKLQMDEVLGSGLRLSVCWTEDSWHMSLLAYLFRYF